MFVNDKFRLRGAKLLRLCPKVVFGSLLQRNGWSFASEKQDVYSLKLLVIPLRQERHVTQQ
jgi:hypothetical protein